MKFIEYQNADIFEFRVILQTPCENAFRHNFNTRSRRNLALHPYGVTHRFAHDFTQRIGHALGRRPRRQASRLQHHDAFALKPRCIQQRQRHARCLASSRFGHENGTGISGQSRFKIGKHKINRKIHGTHFCD